MICFNSAPVNNALASCGSAPRRETVDNARRRQQRSPVGNNGAHNGFSALSTASTGPSATTLFLLYGSNN
jgi:hypothetical protein